MPIITECTEVRSPPAGVWPVLADVGLLPSLSSSTVAVRCDGLLERVGQTFDQTVRAAGLSATSTWSVREIDPPHRLVIDGRLPGGAPCRLVETIAPAGTGSRLCIAAEYELPLGPLGRAAGRLGLERRARRDLIQVLDGVARRAARSGGRS